MEDIIPHRIVSFSDAFYLQYLINDSFKCSLKGGFLIITDCKIESQQTLESSKRKLIGLSSNLYLDEVRFPQHLVGVNQDLQ